MSDFMTARLPDESGLPEGITILTPTVLKDRTDPDRMSVQFIVGADSPDKAFAFARDSRLIEEGLQIVRKEGLAAPGVNGSAIPVACNEKGEPVTNPMGTIDPNLRERYWYMITYQYLGED